MENASSQRQTPKVQSISRRFSYAFIGVVTLLLFGFAAVAIFINITESGTRKEELLHSLEEVDKINEIRRELIQISKSAAILQLKREIEQYKTNHVMLAN